MRTIDADALKIDYGFTWDDITPTHEEMYALIDRQPTIELEQRKGKWIATQEWGGRNYSCSCCKFSFIVDTCMLEPMWNFCPNCGAEIEGRR